MALSRRRPKLPLGPEKAYERELVAISQLISTIYAKGLAPQLKHAKTAERQDADVGTYDLGTLRLQVLARLKKLNLSKLVDRYGRRIVKANAKEVAGILGIVPDIGVAGLERALAAFRSRNLGLIASIAERQHNDLSALMVEAATSGMRAATLKDKIAERFRVSRSRSSLVAKNETLTLNGQLTQIQHLAAGVTEYVWNSSADERVRDIHVELDGRRFSWDDPPISSEDGSVGHPGEPINCRCVAVPVMPAE